MVSSVFRLKILNATEPSKLPEMSKYSVAGESFEDFAKRIADMLLEPEKFRKFYPLLEKLGFGSKQITLTAPAEKKDRKQKHQESIEHMFIEMDIPQCKKIAEKISKDPRYNHLRQINDTDERLILRITAFLRAEKTQFIFWEYLNEHFIKK